MRAFICIELSEEVKKEISKIIDKVKKVDSVRAKFVEPENIHLTLMFLGEISDKEAEMTKEALSSIKMKKFKVELGELGVFSPSYIRILWINLLGEELKKLQQEIEKSLGDLFPREEREWQSHVTLARVKSLKDKPLFLQNFKEIQFKHINFTVSSFKIKKSTLTEKGPIYEDIGEFKLI